MRSAIFNAISRPSMMQGPAMRTIGFPPPILILPILIIRTSEAADLFSRIQSTKKSEEFQRGEAAGRLLILKNSIAYLTASAYFGATMLALRAYAKINLGLRILRLRNDGYHDLETVFHRIKLFDELELERADTISIECFPAELPADERNLSYKAALLLRKELARGDGVHIKLRKNIPLGAGLGGGSSDAASALLGLLQLWEAALPIDRLRSVAAQLGSDVPFFLEKGMAYATGRGDVLDYFHVEFPYWIVVVSPNIHISTAWAYQELKNSKRAIGNDRVARSSLKDLLIENLNDPRMLQNLIRNDFEPIVLGTHDAVVRLKRGLYDAGADFAQLSGSGSAVYGLFKTEAAAHSATEAFSGEHLVSTTPPNFDPDV